MLQRGLIARNIETKPYELFWLANASEARDLSPSDRYCRKIEDSLDQEVDFPVGMCCAICIHDTHTCTHSYTQTHMYRSCLSLSDSLVGIAWADEGARTALSDAVVAHSSMSFSSSSAQLTLSDCLHKFTTVELLGPEDPWYCTHCKALMQASKHLELWSRPDYLVVQLKRFHVAQGFYFREKIDCMVEYPHELDLTPFLTGPQRQQQVSHTLTHIHAYTHAQTHQRSLAFQRGSTWMPRGTCTGLWVW